LDTFKGSVVLEPFNNDIIDDEEIGKYLGCQSIEEVQAIKANWIQNFVSQNGFSML
jgi:hypothetical protein